MKGSNINTLQTVMNGMIPPIASAVTNAAMNRLTGMISGSDSKTYQPTNAQGLGNRARQSNGGRKVYYMPGGAPSKSSRRRRNRRNRGFSRRGGRNVGRGQGGGGPNGPSSAFTSGAPVSISTGFGASENVFISRGIRDSKHGPGTSVAFSAFLCDVYTDGGVLHSDYKLPFAITTMPNQSMASGFVNLGATQSSGFYLHPFYFGTRMARENANWTQYVWRWIKITYVPTCATSQPGSLTIAVTRDPVNLIEGGGTQTAPAISYSNLTQVIPFATGSVYTGLSVFMRNRENLPLNAEIVTNYVAVQGYGDYAYDRTASFGRFAGLLDGTTTGAGTIRYGKMWIEGVIDYFQPNSSTISLTYITSNTNSALNSTPHTSLYSTALKKGFSCLSQASDSLSDPFTHPDSQDEIKIKGSREHKEPLKTSWDDDDLSPVESVPCPPGTLNTGRTLVHTDVRGSDNGESKKKGR